MNTNITVRNIPAWLKVGAYFLIIFAAAILATKLPAIDSIFYFFGVALFLSYVLVRLEGYNLSDLGSLPTSRKDWRQLLMGTMVGMIALGACAALSLWVTDGKWILNAHIDPVYLLILFSAHLFSAYAQEFTYRGYPFQRLLKSYGPLIAQLGVTLPFAVMHLKLDQPITASQFLLLWLTTGVGSLLYGLCYIKTGKLCLSIGLHFGWNIVQSMIPRSAAEPKGAILTLVSSGRPENILRILLPYFVISLLLYWWISKMPQRSLQNDKAVI
ncbi:CPBP family intramembrane glutamic endopeptidase [Mucilaginibacter agri]|uniref:CPBP family intramembrane metalloprotease n=1 Tax=Mucilaginibacter agri TaxID=2695265 RepID=A0A965ZF88_9SPHI|nr:CPBP family intramembrane glutamic endopeptidase [Mucilaginibacter agri]NCD68571.1 CPBP family intramembrane metalloprotease [Mucilaginibacter agri]